MIASNAQWFIFFAIIISLLVIDLGIFSAKNRLLAKPTSGSKVLEDLGAQDRNVHKVHEDPSTKSTTQIAAEVGFGEKSNETMSFAKSLMLSLFYIAISCLFGIFVFLELGDQAGKEYFTGFLLEKAMSIDNIFVISMIFTFFKIPDRYQHRVLFWGILGVIVFRAIMILAGATLLAKFAWVLYLFALILIITGIKMLKNIDNDSFSVDKLYLYQLMQKHLNIHQSIEDESFFVKKQGKWFVTPLFLALMTIEIMDIIFAIDSIPAIFAITQNIFVVYTSNIFAILGLRALYFCIVHAVHRFKYIKYSLSIILVLIGVKIFAMHYVHIPTYIPLLITLSLLIAGILVSIIKSEQKGNL